MRVCVCMLVCMHVCVCACVHACVCVCVAKPVAVELRCHATALIVLLKIICGLKSYVVAIHEAILITEPNL